MESSFSRVGWPSSARLYASPTVSSSKEGCRSDANTHPRGYGEPLAAVSRYGKNERGAGKNLSRAVVAVGPVNRAWPRDHRGQAFFIDALVFFERLGPDIIGFPAFQELFPGLIKPTEKHLVHPAAQIGHEFDVYAATLLSLHIGVAPRQLFLANEDLFIGPLQNPPMVLERSEVLNRWNPSMENP